MLNTEDNRTKVQQALDESETAVFEGVQPDPTEFEYPQRGTEVCVAPRRQGAGLLVARDLEYRGDDSRKAQYLDHDPLEVGWRPVLALENRDAESILRRADHFLGLNGESGGDNGEEVIPPPEVEPDDEGLSFGESLVDRAEEGKLDKVIGREAEVRALCRVEGKAEKNAACLVGPAGVGKTAIVEALAQKVAQGEVPPALEGCDIRSVNLALLSADASIGRQFKEILDRARDNDDLFLFFDEVQVLARDQSLANMAKEDLGRGRVRCIGATTLGEYKTSVAEDPALSRRFEPIYVTEPSVEETVEILESRLSKFQSHHQVEISEDLLRPIVDLADRFLPNRHLPDKAIDLLDEAASERALSASSKQ